MSRLLSCGTLSDGVPLLTANAGPMEDGMNIEAKIAAPCSQIAWRVTNS